MELTVRKVVVAFDKQAVLRDVSFTVQDREFVGILGPNGSGKSTLLKCIYRVLRADAGCIWLDGQELKRFKLRESARKLAVVAQHTQHSFDFSVQEVVLMGRSPHKGLLERDSAADYAIAAACLDQVGLADFAGRKFNTLSGGEQQRVILARALAQQTECLILDEPTNHLDIKYQLQLLHTVKQMKLTVVAAIHDLNLAAMFCDRLVLLQDGVIVADGTPAAVLTPALIKQVYGVEAKVQTDAATGQLHILYQAF